MRAGEGAGISAAGLRDIYSREGQVFVQYNLGKVEQAFVCLTLYGRFTTGSAPGFRTFRKNLEPNLFERAMRSFQLYPALR